MKIIKINENSFGEILEMKIDTDKRECIFFSSDVDILGNLIKTKTKTISFDFLSGNTF